MDELNEWMREWVSGWMNYVKVISNRSVNVRINELTDEQMEEWTSEWMSEQKNKWKKSVHEYLVKLHTINDDSKIEAGKDESGFELSHNRNCGFTLVSESDNLQCTKYEHSWIKTC